MIVCVGFQKSAAGKEHGRRPHNGRTMLTEDQATDGEHQKGCQRACQDHIQERAQDMIHCQLRITQVDISDVDCLINENIQKGTKQRAKPGGKFFPGAVHRSFVFDGLQGLIREGERTEQRRQGIERQIQIADGGKHNLHQKAKDHA